MNESDIQRILAAQAAERKAQREAIWLAFTTAKGASR